jgi:hypothetical protein
MRIQVVFAFGFMLLVTAVHAQDFPVTSRTQITNDMLPSDSAISPAPQQITPSTPNADAILSIVNPQPLPAKPQPVAYMGQWIGDGDQTPQFSDDLIMTERKSDGHWMWHVEKVNSCAWCGAPLTWKQSMFDRKALSMWVLRSALVVADIEITHHMPCFQAGTCKESNPLVGQTRLQGYSVAAGLTAFTWIGDAWLRKGNRTYRIGGSKYWWIIPIIGDATSAVGILSNLARWHSR